MEYTPPNGPVCPSCGSHLVARVQSRTQGYGGYPYDYNIWHCPDNCIITPRTVCAHCGAPMIVVEWNVPSTCSKCGKEEEAHP